MISIGFFRVSESLDFTGFLRGACVPKFPPLCTEVSPFVYRSFPLFWPILHKEYKGYMRRKYVVVYLEVSLIARKYGNVGYTRPRSTRAAFYTSCTSDTGKKEEGGGPPPWLSLGLILSWPPSLSLGRFLGGGFLGGPGRSPGGLVGLLHQYKVHHEAGILIPGEP